MITKYLWRYTLIRIIWHWYISNKNNLIALRKLYLLRALTPLLCQSHGDKCFEISCLLCMSFCFVILYVTIWCKDNKLIIYLSKKTVNEINYPKTLATQRPLAKALFIALSSSNRGEAMKQENNTEREIKRIVGKETSPCIVVGVNFTTKGNLTLHIKYLDR